MNKLISLNTLDVEITFLLNKVSDLEGVVDELTNKIYILELKIANILKLNGK